MSIELIHGFGAKKVAQLKNTHHITTITQLRALVKRMPDIISDAQMMGLKYHTKINKPITRAAAMKIVAAIKKVSPRITIAGSIRREQKTIGDIDIITCCDIRNMVDKLTTAGIIIDNISIGDTKYSGIVKVGSVYRRIDLMHTTKTLMPYMLMYLTGSMAHNIKLRRIAKKMGYTLSQHGLINIKSGRNKILNSEQAIYKFLGVEYVPPTMRTS